MLSAYWKGAPFLWWFALFNFVPVETVRYNQAPAAVHILLVVVFHQPCCTIVINKGFRQPQPSISWPSQQPNPCQVKLCNKLYGAVHFHLLAPFVVHLVGQQPSLNYIYILKTHFHLLVTRSKLSTPNPNGYTVCHTLNFFTYTSHVTSLDTCKSHIKNNNNIISGPPKCAIWRENTPPQNST